MISRRKILGFLAAAPIVGPSISYFSSAPISAASKMPVLIVPASAGGWGLTDGSYHVNFDQAEQKAIARIIHAMDEKPPRRG